MRDNDKEEGNGSGHAEYAYNERDEEAFLFGEWFDLLSVHLYTKSEFIKFS